MISQKIMQQSLRRSHCIFSRALLNYIVPINFTRSAYIQTRETASSTKASDPNDLLRKQRLNRPISPNLTIYRPQITSVLSILHRNTGLLVSGGFYLFFAVYLASPWLGWHIDSASMAASFGALPVAAKVLLRTTVALPFTFHSFNGVRHLVWDLSCGLSNKQVIRSGWAVVGLSISSALLLGFL
ncbi:succinate dehydrogenase (ubiquinone) cytochrome b560 subunit [Blastomyces dermatitidis ATCC 18188]|uniref:Succinate dehydrogenase (Ubiquinone) cytochrome b560 subunit n=1 Tax=Ajellomyces dermatitidis (strain ATCC 18188 / CBS 674.68) TaxID=653446 RepID=F2TBS8_AJEDA|nr:succinate dehydrogenase (ubiquinone) cytochrome b560 subunit [Blastomyces dermatitidis ATCC 18188]